MDPSASRLEHTAWSAPPRKWRAGFEIEVLLGTLGERAFEEYSGDPMDMASWHYCSVLARKLTGLTGRPWTAPRNEKKVAGFYVVPEYDLDPMDWPKGVVAGVELITPPLPLEEAEKVRRDITAALNEIEPDFLWITGEIEDDCGWHINIDEGGRDLNASRLTGVDELGILWRQERLYKRYTGMQRHSWGVALLRHLGKDPDGLAFRGNGLSNFIDAFGGQSKTYAANFDKVRRANYLELRHYSALEFHEGADLKTLLDPFTSAFTTNEDEALGWTFRRFQVVAAWLKAIRPRFEVYLPERNEVWFVSAVAGKVTFDGEPIAEAAINGTASLGLLTKVGTRRPEIFDVAFHDLIEAVGVLALDQAELKNRRLHRSPLKCRPFAKEVTSLAQQLAKIA